MEKTSQQFLGVGWKFPIEFKTANRSVSMLSGEELIENSLDVLFSTNTGERIMQPEYGSELDHFLFENLSKGVITYLQARISDAILFCEPRIIVNNIEITPGENDPALIEIRIDYTVPVTNSRYNYVYPYYINEGTNLSKYNTGPGKAVE
jgi:phage baseplate assembly protein W